MRKVRIGVSDFINPLIRLRKVRRGFEFARSRLGGVSETILQFTLPVNLVLLGAAAAAAFASVVECVGCGCSGGDGDSRAG